MNFKGYKAEPPEEGTRMNTDRIQAPADGDSTDWKAIARVQSAKLAVALDEPGARERLEAVMRSADWKSDSQPKGTGTPALYLSSEQVKGVIEGKVGASYLPFRSKREGLFTVPVYLDASEDTAPAHDADGEAFRAAARLGLTLRFDAGVAQSASPGTPSAYEVVSGQDRGAAMRQAVSQAAAVIAATQRERFEAWLKLHPDARFWNTTDAMLAAFIGGEGSKQPVQPTGEQS